MDRKRGGMDGERDGGRTPRERGRTPREGGRDRGSINSARYTQRIIRTLALRLTAPIHPNPSLTLT